MRAADGMEISRVLRVHALVHYLDNARPSSACLEQACRHGMKSFVCACNASKALTRWCAHTDLSPRSSFTNSATAMVFGPRDRRHLLKNVHLRDTIYWYVGLPSSGVSDSHQLAEPGQVLCHDNRQQAPNATICVRFHVAGFCKHLAGTPGGLPLSQQQHMKDLLQIITRKLRFDESYNHDKVWVLMYAARGCNMLQSCLCVYVSRTCRT